MRVTCLQENLAKGLSIVGRAVSTRSTLPVLSNILLETENGQLKLVATNLEIGINCWIGAKVEDEGAVTVPARLLTEFVNSLPPEPIEMDLVVRTQSLHLKCAHYDANIKGLDASEFPLVSTSEQMNADGTVIALDPNKLRKMITQVVFAAATDDSRPTLTGVQFTFTGDRLKLAATDGFRLSLRSASLDANPVLPVSIIVPARSLAEVARIVSDADESRPVEVTLSPTRSQILFRIAGTGNGEKGKGGFHRVDLVAQLIEASFPDYNPIVPQSYTTRAVVDTAAFLKAVRVAFLFARDSANIVRFQITPGDEFTPGKLTLTATSAELGDNVNELGAIVEGEGGEIAFNARYLIDVLSVIDEPQVALEISDPRRPGVIRPVGVGPEEFTHVVMPMHLAR